MENKEPTQPPEIRRQADQKMLRDIADVADKLSTHGGVGSPDWFKSKEYPLDPNLWSREDISKVFVGQITEEGRKKYPTMQDSLVVLIGPENEGEEKHTEYYIYKNPNGSLEIDRYVEVRKTMRKLRQEVVESDEEPNIFVALEAGAKKQEARRLEKETGQAEIDNEEAQRLLSILNRLSEEV